MGSALFFGTDLENLGDTYFNGAEDYLTAKLGSVPSFAC
jgi:hypothetical protein